MRAPSGAQIVRRSLVRRLVVLAAIWSFAVLVVGGIALSVFINQANLRSFDDGILDSLNELIAGTVFENEQIAPPNFSDTRTLLVYSGQYWQIATPDGKGGLTVLARSRSLWDQALARPQDKVLAAMKNAGQPIFYDAKGPQGVDLRIGMMWTSLQDYPAPVVFMAGADRGPIAANNRRFDLEVAVTLIALGVGLLAAVIIQVRIGLRPVFALQHEVAGLRTGRSDRVCGVYPVELAPLAEELNALMAHNQEVVERQRTHVGNLAHALKTPVAVLMAEAERSEGALAELVARQSEIMRQQVDHHLRRARAAARAQGQGERTEIAPVLDEVSRTLAKVFHQNLRIDWDAEEGLIFQGERHDFQEIIGNLMENACKWARSRVEVSAAPAGERRVVVRVEDDGPGVPEDDYARILGRGARLDEAAPGTGLGLAIVDELVRAYGGELRLDRSRLGGLLVELSLPSVAA